MQYAFFLILHVWTALCLLTWTLLVTSEAVVHPQKVAKTASRQKLCHHSTLSKPTLYTVIILANAWWPTSDKLRPKTTAHNISHTTLLFLYTIIALQCNYCTAVLQRSAPCIMQHVTAQCCAGSGVKKPLVRWQIGSIN